MMCVQKACPAVNETALVLITGFLMLGAAVGTLYLTLLIVKRVSVRWEWMTY